MRVWSGIRSCIRSISDTWPGYSLGNVKEVAQLLAHELNLQRTPLKVCFTISSKCGARGILSALHNRILGLSRVLALAKMTAIRAIKSELSCALGSIGDNTSVQMLAREVPFLLVITLTPQFFRSTHRRVDQCTPPCA